MHLGVTVCATTIAGTLSQTDADASKSPEPLLIAALHEGTSRPAHTSAVNRQQPTSNPLTAWIFAGEVPSPAPRKRFLTRNPRYRVMWLTGVDYFSSLAYQAGIALVAAGVLAPLATGILVLVTLACAVPVYREVSRAVLCRAWLHRHARAHPPRMVEQALRPGLTGLRRHGFRDYHDVERSRLGPARGGESAAEAVHRRIFTLPSPSAFWCCSRWCFSRDSARRFGWPFWWQSRSSYCNGIVIVRCAIEGIPAPELLRNWHAALSSHGETWSHILAAAVDRLSGTGARIKRIRNRSSRNATGPRRSQG